jgi:hypothetical protein
MRGGWLSIGSAVAEVDLRADVAAQDPAVEWGSDARAGFVERAKGPGDWSSR